MTPSARRSRRTSGKTPIASPSPRHSRLGAVEHLEARIAPATFTVTTVADSGNGSLRQAITDANNATGPDSIVFAIAGTGVQTITPLTPLPTITDPVAIDGFTQPGSSPNSLPVGGNAVMKIAISGTSLGTGDDGLLLSSGGNKIRGLVMYGFGRAAIDTFTTSDNNFIEGNYIGLDASGTTAMGGGNGILIFSNGNTVGGSTPDKRNVVAGVSGDGVGVALGANNTVLGNYIGTNAAGSAAVGAGIAGIDVYSGATNTTVGGLTTGAGNVIGSFFHGVYVSVATDTFVQGNFIGTDATGSSAIPNFNFGVTVTNNSTRATIGGTATGAGNLLSGNSSGGISIVNASGVKVLGNLIGVAKNGVTPLGNNGGILINNGSNNQIGDISAGSGNLIANNVTGVGISGSSSGNSVRGNAIFSNQFVNIDLGYPNGPTPNDADDSDTGPNNLQNYPTITGGTRSAAGTGINASITTVPNSTVTFEFYANPINSSAGQVYLGTGVVSTDAAGVGTATFSPPNSLPNFSSYYITATATDANGNTSEFSPAFQLASTYRWDGGGGTDTSWFNPLNWDLDAGVPGALDSAVQATTKTISLPSSVTVLNLDISGGTLTGAGDITITRNFNWDGGTLAGSGNLNIASTAAGNFSTFTKTLAGQNIHNFGAINWVAGDITFDSGSITNEINSSFLIQSSATMTDSDGTSTPSTFINSGQVRKIFGSGTTTISGLTQVTNQPGSLIENAASAGSVLNLASPVDNSGIVRANSGKLLLGAGGTGDGIFDAFNGQILEFSGGTYTINPGGSLASAGTFQLSGGTLVANTNLTAVNFSQNGGTLDGSGDLSVNVAFKWTGGSMTGSGSTNLGPGNHTISGISNKAIDGRTLANDGSLAITGSGSIALNSGQIINHPGASIDFQSSVTILDTDGGTQGSFSNQGNIQTTFSQIGGATPTGVVQILSLPFNNTGGIVNNAGTLQVDSFTQDAGQTQIFDTLQGQFTFNGGTLLGAGTINGSLNNSGATVRPGLASIDINTGNVTLSGSISLNGSYIQGAAATLSLEVGGSSFSAIQATGPVTLDGSVSVAYSAGYVPSAPMTYALVAGSSVGGTFATQNLPSFATSAYNPTNYSVTVVPAPPDVVTTTQDIEDANDNQTSLREAIIYANNHPGLDTITFAIPGSGQHVISVLSDLPAISDPIIINGYSQPGSGVNTLPVGSDATFSIVLDGSLLTAGTLSGGLNLSIGSDGSTIKGLVIQKFQLASGFLAGGDGITILSSNNTISGNMLIDNSGAGVFLAGSGNLIGGTIGSARNIISGNSTGIYAEGNSSGHSIQGNLIGTDQAGTSAHGNSLYGIFFGFGANGNTVGGTVPNAGNVISGNSNDGVHIQNVGSDNNTIRGNYIGTNAAGTATIGNGGNGILVISGSSGTIIGGDDADDGNLDGIVAARNIVSGNPGGISVVLSSASQGTIIKGNYVGTDVTGTVVLGGTAGISLTGSNSAIGGSTPGAGNLIVGQDNGAIRVSGSDNTVQGNFVGTDSTGTSTFGNIGVGIAVLSGSNIKIGGLAAGEANLIAYTTGTGVSVSSDSTGVAILGNSIFGSSLRGIDLNADGATANDADDSDTGANGLLNYPVITSVLQTINGSVANGSITTDITGTIHLEFFTGSSGQGKTFIGSADIATTAGQATTFNITLPGSVGPGDQIVATASDLTPSSGLGTSEYSPAFTVADVGSVVIRNALVVEGSTGTKQMVFTLELNQSLSSSVSVDFNTADFSSDAANATADLDYTSKTGTVTFAPGTTTATLSIDITTDTLAEGRERFLVQLSNPVGLTISRGEAIGIIQDDDHHTFAVGSSSGNSFAIYSTDGTSASLVQTIQAFSPNFRGGVRVAVGDVTGDGVDDYIAGAGSGGRAKVIVFDGTTLQPVGGTLGNLSAFANTYRGGVYVAAGDVDGDGHSDIIVSTSAGSQNQVRVFSGEDGSMLGSFKAFGVGSGGIRVAAGDFNGDGLAEIIAGTGIGSKVRIFSFHTSSGFGVVQMISEVQAFSSRYKGGVSVAAGDLDSDGYDDLIVGAASGSATVVARLFDGEGYQFSELTAYPGKVLRGVRVAALDVNGDGIADLITSKGRLGDNRISVFDGNTFNNLFSFSALTAQRDGLYVG